ncbi:MAG: hypothetical protein ACFFG0_29505 [Candidatus Thorarchaeota archaeon]
MESCKNEYILKIYEYEEVQGLELAIQNQLEYLYYMINVSENDIIWEGGIPDDEKEQAMLIDRVIPSDWEKSNYRREVDVLESILERLDKLGPETFDPPEAQLISLKSDEIKLLNYALKYFQSKQKRKIRKINTKLEKFNLLITTLSAVIVHTRIGEILGRIIADKCNVDWWEIT